jgi:elongation factor 1-beta
MGMARVAVVLKVYPSSVEIQPSQLLEKIKSILPGDYKIEASGEEPIAFGLKALKLVVSMPEETEGGTARLEEMIRDLEEVNEIEVEAVHRMS